jgi:hypothetical protein
MTIITSALAFFGYLSYINAFGTEHSISDVCSTEFAASSLWPHLLQFFSHFNRFYFELSFNVLWTEVK